MKNSIVFQFVFFLLLSCFCATGFSGQAGDYNRTSLLKVLSSPSSSHEGLVIVRGWYCSLDIERFGLFLTKDDCRNENYENAIQLELTKEQGVRLAESSGALVTFHGQFYSWEGRVALDTPFVWGLLKVDRVYLY